MRPPADGEGSELPMGMRRAPSRQRRARERGHTGVHGHGHDHRRDRGRDILSRIAIRAAIHPNTARGIGVLTSILGQFSQDCCGVHMYRSFELWEAIDGHLLLFIFLPPLLFAD